MSIELKEHNQETYEKVKDKFKESNKVAILDTMGTGKMYIALKLLEDNKEKSSIYLSPSSAILHDVKKNIFASNMNMTDFPNLKRMTYQKLVKLSEEEMEKLECDIIILDEFHHCGGPEWEKGVERLMERNPGAKVLGLSATPIRYFDGLRDMAEELFENNIASEMSLEEAIERGILPEVTYVSALYGYDKDELSNMQSNIEKIKDKDKKNEVQELFDRFKNDLDENVDKLPEFFEKYMENKTGKYIIFCKNIEDMQEKMEKAPKMFGKVNSNINVRGVSSKIKETDKILTEFENDDDKETLKLLYSINMINEGYHPQNLDAVILFRPTYSPTVYEQQITRGFNINGKKVLVLDLVDNFDSCRIIKDFAERMRKYKRKYGENKISKSKKKTSNSRITVIDETRNFREIADKISQLSKKDKVFLDEKIEIFERFFEKNEELTGNTIFEGYPIGRWAVLIRSLIKNFDNNDKRFINPTEEQLERLNKLGILDRSIDSIINKKIDMIIEWIKKYPKAKVNKNVSEELLKATYCQNEEDYILFNKEYNKIKKCYNYLRHIKSDGKISEEQFLKCKEGGIGGIFGYPTQIEELAKKSGQSNETIEYIINNYETMDNFKNLYRNGELNEDELLIAQKIFRIVFDIDINSNINYDNLYLNLYSKYLECYSLPYGNIQFYSSEALKKLMVEKLDEREKYILERRYGLLENGIEYNQKSLAVDLKVSSQRICHLESRAIQKLFYNRENFQIFSKELEKANLQNDVEFTNEIINCVKNKINELEEKIFSTDIMYLNSSYEILQSDYEYREILKYLYSDIEDMFEKIKLINLSNKNEEDIINKKLNELDLSVRSLNCLERSGFDTIEDILGCSIDELMKIRNMGCKSCNEIIEKLKSLGIKVNENGEFEIDYFADNVAECATQKLQLKEKDEKAYELEQLYLKQWPDKQYTVDEN